MDKDSNKLEQINIDYTDENLGGYLEMVKVANAFYITVPSSNRQETGEAGLNKIIVPYNVENKE